MATLADKLLKYASEIKKRNLENSRFVSFSERTLIYELNAGSQASTHVLYFSPPTLCLKLIFNVALRSTDCEGEYLIIKLTCSQVHRRLCTSPNKYATI